MDKVYNEDGTVKAEWKPDGGDFEYPFCRKYIDPKFDGDKTSTRPFLIRFTDIAMVYAEAAGPTTKAYELIHFIRQYMKNVSLKWLLKEIVCMIFVVGAGLEKSKK